MPNTASWPWPKIAHAIGYWVLSFWTIYLAIGVVDNLIEVHTAPYTLQHVWSNFAFYKVTSWLYFVLIMVAVFAQVRCVRLQRVSPVTLLSAMAVPTVYAAIIVFDLNPVCCT